VLDGKTRRFDGATLQEREEPLRRILLTEEHVGGLRFERRGHCWISLEDRCSRLTAAHASEHCECAFLHIEILRDQMRVDNRDAGHVTEFFEQREPFKEHLPRSLRVSDVGLHLLADGGQLRSKREPGSQRVVWRLLPRGTKK